VPYIGKFVTRHTSDSSQRLTIALRNFNDFPMLCTFLFVLFALRAVRRRLLCHISSIFYSLHAAYWLVALHSRMRTRCEFYKLYIDGERYIICELRVSEVIRRRRLLVTFLLTSEFQSISAVVCLRHLFATKTSMNWMRSSTFRRRSLRYTRRCMQHHSLRANGSPPPRPTTEHHTRSRKIVNRRKTECRCMYTIAAGCAIRPLLAFIILI